MKRSFLIESERQQARYSNNSVRGTSPVRQAIDDNRESTAIQRQLIATMANSPQAITQRLVSQQMHSSARMLVQRRMLPGISGEFVQRFNGEEPLSEKFSPLQRVKEEESFQKKLAAESSTQLPPHQRTAKLNNTGLPSRGLEKEAGFMGIKATQMMQWQKEKPDPVVSTKGFAAFNASSSTAIQQKNLAGKGTIQAYKLLTPKAIREKLAELNAYIATENDSISKELPSWFGSNKGGRIRDHDFASNDEFLSVVREMITTVDSFTDEQGFALRDKINHSGNSKIFIGYNAGNAAYAEDMVKEGLKNKAVASGLKADMQLSHGHYISPDIGVLDSYISERTSAGKDAVVYKVYIDLTKVVNFPILMKGASIKQWWSNYDTSFDDNYDIVVAALSGHTNIIQYKINPKSYHLLTFEVFQLHKKA